MMEIIERIKEISDQASNRFLTGGKPMGYLCSYVPLEIIHAAGFIPYRLRTTGSKDTSLSDDYYTSLNCSHIRHCFNNILLGDYGFLKGIVFMNGCDHSRRLFDNCIYSGKAPSFTWMLEIPRNRSDESLERYRENLKCLIRAIEDFSMTAVTPERLRASILIFNRIRRLLNRLSRMRAHTSRVLSGSNFLRIMLAITAIPPEIALMFLEELSELYAGEKNNEPAGPTARIILVGNCCDEVEHLETIEKSGIDIVSDKICLGSSFFSSPVREEGDPVASIAERYLHQPSCPRMADDKEGRLRFILNSLQQSGADAVIFDKIQFCTLFAGDTYIMKKELQDAGIPFLLLDREARSGAKGQILTRLQAFTEKIMNIKEKNGFSGGIVNTGYNK